MLHSRLYTAFFQKTGYCNYIPCSVEHIYRLIGIIPEIVDFEDCFHLHLNILISFQLKLLMEFVSMNYEQRNPFLL